jgi:hypothetical protein
VIGLVNPLNQTEPSSFQVEVQQAQRVWWAFEAQPDAGSHRADAPSAHREDLEADHLLEVPPMDVTHLNAALWGGLDPMPRVLGVCLLGVVASSNHSSVQLALVRSDAVPF